MSRHSCYYSERWCSHLRCCVGSFLCRINQRRQQTTDPPESSSTPVKTDPFLMGISNVLFRDVTTSWTTETPAAPDLPELCRTSSWFLHSEAWGKRWVRRAKEGSRPPVPPPAFETREESSGQKSGTEEAVFSGRCGTFYRGRKHLSVEERQMLSCFQCFGKIETR